jgi:hypothetical protein
MTTEEKALVHYRLERAHESLIEAKLLFDTGHFHTYVFALKRTPSRASLPSLSIQDYLPFFHNKPFNA